MRRGSQVLPSLPLEAHFDVSQSAMPKAAISSTEKAWGAYRVARRAPSMRCTLLPQPALLLPLSAEQVNRAIKDRKATHLYMSLRFSMRLPSRSMIRPSSSSPVAPPDSPICKISSGSSVL